MAQKATATWPVPDKPVTVNGRQLPMDLVGVIGVNVLGSLIMLVSMWRAITNLPDLIVGLFDGNSFVFGFSWVLLILVITVLYVALAPLAAAWFLLRADPIGRDLETLFLGLLFLVAFDGAVSSGWFWLVFLVVAACVAVLYLSPWVKAAFRESERGRGVPRPLVTARFLTAVLFSLIGLIALVLLPGLRFIGDLGVGYVLLLAVAIGACVLAWQGYAGLGRGDDAAVPGRLRLTWACGLVLAVSILGAASSSGSFQSSLPTLLIAGGIVALLWLPASSKAWFQARTPVTSTPGSTGTPGTPGPTSTPGANGPTDPSGSTPSS